MSIAIPAFVDALGDIVSERSRCWTDARAELAMVALLIVGLAGCAAEPNRPPADAAPYVGVFTGEFVDGKPLYRFPTIEVVGFAE